MSGVKKTRAKKVPAAPAPVAAEPVPEQEQAPAPEVAEVPEAKSKKQAPRAVKREKKPIKVVAVITPDGIEGTFTPEPRKPLIVHLPFSSSEVKFADANIRYDPTPPTQPVPYGEDTLYFQVNTEESSGENQIGVEKDGWKMQLEDITNKTNVGTGALPVFDQPVAQPVGAQTTPFPQENFQRIQLLTCYSTKPGEVLQLPKTTNIICFWCSNNFSNAPCFLPVKEENNIYHVYGNFCTPQCGLAYLLNEHLDSHVRWERMALLHRMYRPNGSQGGRLYPAPPRESLVEFGGTYTYEKFREVISLGKVRIDIHKPPMVSILGVLDTKPIDFYDSSLQNTFTQGFSMDRFKAWSEQGGALRLKRSKPLKDRDSTLDACIHISVKRGSE